MDQENHRISPPIVVTERSPAAARKLLSTEQGDRKTAINLRKPHYLMEIGVSESCSLPGLPFIPPIIIIIRHSLAAIISAKTSATVAASGNEEDERKGQNHQFPGFRFISYDTTIIDYG
jgi:hypothetical protein